MSKTVARKVQHKAIKITALPKSPRWVCSCGAKERVPHATQVLDVLVEYRKHQSSAS